MTVEEMDLRRAMALMKIERIVNKRCYERYKRQIYIRLEQFEPECLADEYIPLLTHAKVVHVEDGKIKVDILRMSHSIHNELFVDEEAAELIAGIIYKVLCVNVDSKLK